MFLGTPYQAVAQPLNDFSVHLTQVTGLQRCGMYANSLQLQQQ